MAKRRRQATTSIFPHKRSPKSLPRGERFNYLFLRVLCVSVVNSCMPQKNTGYDAVRRPAIASNSRLFAYSLTRFFAFSLTRLLASGDGGQIIGYRADGFDVEVIYQDLDDVGGEEGGQRGA